MDYQLAKSLKDSGFPQNGVGITGSYYKGDPQFDDTEDINYWVKVPTLSELIEACGEDFLLTNEKGGITNKKWMAWSNQGTAYTSPVFMGEGSAKYQCDGDTPEEAVACLYLHLKQDKMV